MKVKELIIALLEEDMDDEVRVLVRNNDGALSDWENIFIDGVAFEHRDGAELGIVSLETNCELTRNKKE